MRRSRRRVARRRVARLRRWSPRLRMLAVGTALVALATGVAACGIPTDGAPTAIAKDKVPFHLLSPASPTTSTTRPSATVPVHIFLVAPTQHVLAVAREVPIPATLTEILTALLEGPTEAESTSGLQSFLSPTKNSVTATVSGGVATVDFTRNPVQVVGPNQTLAIAQVVFTATEQPGVTSVAFQIAGEHIGVPTSSGAQEAGPVGRSSYQTLAPTG